MTSVRPQPLITVSDVPAASRWYQQVLGASSAHGGEEYERLCVDDVLVLQLHRAEVEHHHGPLVDPLKPTGNGVALWFEVDDFELLVACSREAGAQVVLDVHVNPNARHREIWLRDLDGYLVVCAEG
jgi:catechol 2,3-dioxygenase-like lactoylglutathione lyase family enzyme